MLHPDCQAFLEAGTPILLGLSGGRDSVALLHLLVGQGCAVIARHLNHGIRGAEAEADAAFCQQLCAKLGVDYDQEQLDIPALAQEAGQSLELAARKHRRAYLMAQARATGCASIALAQHADDQAETVLFRLARGAAGLRGMLPVSSYEGLTLLRPLLNWRRSDITQYLQTRGQTWREDASNESCEHSRNALRHQVLPAYAEAMGRDIVPIINRSAALQAETAVALQESLQLLRPHFYDPQGRLYLPALEAAKPELVRALLCDYLQGQGIPDISAKLVRDIQDMLPADAVRYSLNLPGGKQFRRAHQRGFIQIIGER
ncbi:MAG: tRNA lysidine(34) synthetase TilS [Akkermansia sp.]